MNPKVFILLILFWKLYFPGYSQKANSQYQVVQTFAKDGIEVRKPKQWKEQKIVSQPKQVSLKGSPQIRKVNTNVLPILEKEIIVIPPSSLASSSKVLTPDTPTVQVSILPVTQLKPERAFPPIMRDSAVYDIQCLDVDQGLISSYIRSMLEDQDGYLWIGTSYGISRYDGTNFTNYNSLDIEGQTNNSILSMIKDSRDQLWFGTRNGLICYDGNQLINYTFGNYPGANTIWSILEDQYQNLWIGTSNGVLQLKQRGTKSTFSQFTTIQGLIDNDVLSIEEDGGGNLWFGTDNGLSRFIPSPNLAESLGYFINYSTEDGLRDNIILSMLRDSKGHLWIGTKKGLCQFLIEENTEQFIYYKTGKALDDSPVSSILEDKQGHLWLGTNNGVYNVQPYSDSPEIYQLTSREGLSKNEVRSIIEDSKGNLWFGTGGGGVCRLAPSSFFHFTTQNGLLDNAIMSIQEDSIGHLWLGTGMGISHFDGNRFKYFTSDNGLVDNDVRSIQIDKKGNIWCGTSSGLSCFDGSTFKNYTSTEGLIHNDIKSIYLDSRDQLWIGTSRGLSRFDGYSFTNYTIKPGFRGPYIRMITEDQHGNIWFGTSEDGIYSFDGTHFKPYTTEDGLSSNYVLSLMKGSNGMLWIGTNKGINYFNGQNFTSFTTKDGLSDNIIWSIVEDEKKDIWLSTEKGITLLKVLPDTSNQANLSEPSYQFYTFKKQDGLKRMDFHSNSVHFDSRGRIWWGSEGLTRLDYTEFKLSGQAPETPKISHIEINQHFIDYRQLSNPVYSNTTPFGQKLKKSVQSPVSYYNYPAYMALPHQLDHLTIYFSAIDWASPHKLVYQYYLEGLEEGWSMPNTEYKVDYRDLPFGNYTFKIRAKGEAAQWSPTLEYPFTIKTPWWHTSFAYLFYVIIIFVFLYALYSFLLSRKLQLQEHQRLKNLDELKTKLYTNITHEFRTPLTVILGMVEQIKARPSNWLPQGLEMIERNGKSVLNLVNQLLDLRKLESGMLPVQLQQGDIITYFKYIVESFQPYAEFKGIDLVFQTNTSNLIMDYDPDKMLTILSNLLSNALKFTPEKGQVKVQIQASLNTETDLTIKISDSGPGIPKDKLPFIFGRFYQVEIKEGTGIGLAITRELVKLLNGKIFVESTPGIGTIFTLIMPVTTSALPETSANASLIKEKVSSFVPQKQDVGHAEYGASNKAELPLLLIIENNEDIIKYLETFLPKTYRLAKTHNGQQGIDKAFEIIPDLIISDVRMPQKNGFEVCSVLKNDERTSHIPIVLLTAKADLDSKIEGFKKGADAYITKPFSPQELLVRLQKLTELRSRLKQYYLSLATLDQEHLTTTSLEGTEKTEHSFVTKTQTIIKAHLDDNTFTVKQLCKEIGISHPQLHRKLTALTGYSANKFIKHIRLNRAKSLLLETEETITEIAYATGFSDPDYFGRVFKQEFGQTPSDFRKHSNS